MSDIFNNIGNFLGNTGIAKLFTDFSGFGWKTIVMYAIVIVLFYLAVVKKFEPMLLIPIAFGMLLANLPGAELYHSEFFFDAHYIKFSESGEITGLYATEMKTFLKEITTIFGEDAYHITSDGILKLNVSAFSQNFDGFVTLCRSNIENPAFRDIVNSIFENAFTQTGSTWAFNPDVLNDAFSNSKTAYDAVFKPIFHDCLGGVAKLKESSDGTLIQIKMSCVVKEVFNAGGLLDILYIGVKFGIYPSLIFLGIGAMTDFSPLIANPKSLLLGAAAQFGVFAAFFFALLIGFTPAQAAAIGIIGGADGPTAILVTKTLAPELLGAIAIAAYSYMALIPMIQPPIMKALTTPRERSIVMTGLRSVSKAEKVVFPILVTLLVVLIVPDAAPLVGFLMLGNLFNVSGVTDRLSKTGQNELINIITIFLGVSVGATANAENFLAFNTLKIIALGLGAFMLSTTGGLLFGKLMCFLTKGKINPLIGSAGVSAVPMAARVAQDVGRRSNPSNFLLMHAMGPNVAGVIGSAVAAGVFLTWFA